MAGDERIERIQMLERLIDSERFLLAHPRFGVASRHVVLAAQRELRRQKELPVKGEKTR